MLNDVGRPRDGEPILAKALGGVQNSGRSTPVRRSAVRVDSRARAARGRRLDRERIRECLPLYRGWGLAEPKLSLASRRSWRHPSSAACRTVLDYGSVEAAINARGRRCAVSEFRLGVTDGPAHLLSRIERGEEMNSAPESADGAVLLELGERVPRAEHDVVGRRDARLDRRRAAGTAPTTRRRPSRGTGGWPGSARRRIRPSRRDTPGDRRCSGSFATRRADIVTVPCPGPPHAVTGGRHRDSGWR